MKTNYKIILALLVGTAIGAVAIQGLHAQAKPPAYLVTEINEITDADGYNKISQRSTATSAEVFKEFGGRYVARTSNTTALDGAAPKRIIVVAFDSAEKAQAYYNSPGQKAVTEIRTKTTKGHAFIVEGM